MLNDRSEAGTPPATAPQPGNQEARRLEETMEQLRAMGFADDNGWLTSLVTAKDYDLNKVLDAIRAPEKR